MFTKFLMVVYKIPVFCILGTILISASFRSYCGSMFCEQEFSQEFDFGSIKSIHFNEIDLTQKRREITKKEVFNESYKRSILEGYPAYFLTFKIVSGNKILDFKDVIFDGVQAEMSVFALYEPSVQLVQIKDFQIGNFGMTPKLLNFNFPVPVTNTFKISLRRRLIDKLKQKDKLKITLVSLDDKKFVLEVDNFLKKYDF